MSADNRVDLETRALVDAAVAGDHAALAELFEQHRDRLRRMVELRLDRRLNGRVDASDVLQEAFIDLANKVKGFGERQNMSFFLWLRMVTGERLLNVHRRHLDAEKRDVRQEISLSRNGVPNVPSVSLAACLLGNSTSASQRVMRAELQQKLQETLNKMDELDREVLALRHFEEFNNKEVAELLGLSKTAASNRYIRALSRLRSLLQDVPGFKF